MTFNAMMCTICARIYEDAEKIILITYKDGIINYCCTYEYTTPPQVAFTIIILY